MYDCLVFYFMPQHEASDGSLTKEMEQLAEILAKHTEASRDSGKGIVVLHHAILAYPNWSLWTEVTGLANRADFKYFDDQRVRYEIADAANPITTDIESWEMLDETYTLSEPVDRSNSVVTTKYDPSMKTIAWTRTFRDARVFCFECGHDASSWMNHNFREVLRRGILWTSGVI